MGSLSTEALNVDSFIESYILYIRSTIERCKRVTLEIKRVIAEKIPNLSPSHFQTELVSVSPP